jgi:hypothetical protein
MENLLVLNKRNAFSGFKKHKSATQVQTMFRTPCGLADSFCGVGVFRRSHKATRQTSCQWVMLRSEVVRLTSPSTTACFHILTHMQQFPNELNHWSADWSRSAKRVASSVTWTNDLFLRNAHNHLTDYMTRSGIPWFWSDLTLTTVWNKFLFFTAYRCVSEVKCKALEERRRNCASQRLAEPCLIYSRR